MNFITSYCHFTDRSVFLNGETFYSGREAMQEDFAKHIYKFLKLDYPRFYKMDLLSRIAFLGVEILKIDHKGIKDYADDAIALFFSNAVSSAGTDIKFKKSYQEEMSPSPSLFVYTLPHILIGEIAIRNKWYGENLFTILPNFDSGFFAGHCNNLLSAKAEACLCGWINTMDNKHDSFIFFVEKKNVQHKNLPLDPETLTKLYIQ